MKKTAYPLNEADREIVLFLKEHFDVPSGTAALKKCIRRMKQLIEFENDGGLYTKAGESFERIRFV